MAILDLGETKVFWQQAGRGRPMVLVHGSWGDAENWAAVVPGLAREFRVVSYAAAATAAAPRRPGRARWRRTSTTLPS